MCGHAYTRGNKKSSTKSFTYVLTISFFVKVGDKYIRIKVYIKRGVIQE